jgi:hypothetical protein
MGRRFMKESATRLALLSMLSVGLVACGGGGGDDAPAPSSDLLDVTAANSDLLAHAAAAALFAVGSASNAIPAGAGASPAVQLAALSTSQRGSLGVSTAWLPQRVMNALMQRVHADRASAAGPSQRALAVTSPPPEACAVAGTVTLSVDDRDNNGSLSLGDMMTITFSDCRDIASEVLNGSATVSVTRIGAAALTSFGAHMTLTQLSQQATDGSHGLAFSGHLILDYEQLSTTSERARLTADGAVTITAHTHAGYVDTVTLQTGFEQLSDYDTSTGITISNTTGMLQSAAAGSGLVSVSTPQSVHLADGNQYPSSGKVNIAGQGSVVLTVLSPTAVQIDLDADGDSSYESRKQETWDWLF